jgi:hypothetical protein
MIEALIAYIEDKGFKVDVFPDRLLISRQAGDKLWSYGWAISRQSLTYARTCKELLFHEADYRLSQFDKAADERRKALSIQAKPPQ